MSVKNQVLFPVRIDKPLQDELQRISEELGLTKSQVVRASILLTIQKPSQIETIIEKEKARIDAWYEKRKGKESNNGNHQTVSEEEALAKAEKLRHTMMEP
jgi:antitoxin component of RelBE/YafQ-DinJ toxin-antitoxin module